MAEFMLRDMVKRKGIENEFYISSSATSSEEIWNGVGNPVYPPAREELLRHGITCEGKRAVQLKKADYDNYDMFLCMDGNNLRNSIRIFGGDKDNKVKKLLGEKDVADPWYSGDFKTAYNDIYKGLCTLMEEFDEKN